MPAGAAVFSAWGMMMSDLRRDYFVTRLADLRKGAAAASKQVFAESEEQAKAQFAAEGIDADKVKFLRYGKFRYQNQEHTTEVLVAGGKVTDERLAEIEAAFHETYEREYTYRLDAPVEMVGIHLVASAEVGKLTMRKREATGAKAERRAEGPSRRRLRAGRRAQGGDLRRRQARTRHELQRPGDRRGFRAAPSSFTPATRSRSTATATSTSISRHEETAMLKKVNDPITLEIIQNSLQATADEMFAVMRKTAMSSIIYEVLDMGTGITDARGALASSGAGIPAFIGVLDKAVKVIVKKFDKPGDIEPGDVFATNDPYYGGVTHLNDIIVAMPVFAGGRIIAWTANIAHNSDVGGMAPGSLTGEATEIFQEGLRLPAIKLISKGETIRSVMEIIKVNSRMPDVLEGDVWAAIASVRIGARRLVELAEKYGVETFENAMSSFMDFGEQVSLAELAKLPQGHVRAVGGAGRRPHLQCEDHHLRHRVHGRPARQSRPVDQPGQHQPRRRDGLRRR